MPTVSVETFEQRESDTKQDDGSKSSKEERTEDVDDDEKIYPTLRSKSLNANPRKKKRDSEEKPRSASSVKDLVSAFSSGTGSQQSKDSDS